MQYKNLIRSKIGFREAFPALEQASKPNSADSLIDLDKTQKNT